MESLGIDFNNTGSVMSPSQLEEFRKKRGECLTCGRKCFLKKLFKMIPITEEGYVLEGRCLHCRPLPSNLSSPGPSRRRTRRTSSEDLERFTRCQSNLSSRNLITSSESSPQTSGRSHIARAASGLARSENISTHMTSSSSSPCQIFRRAASALPAVGRNNTTKQGVSPLPPQLWMIDTNVEEGDHPRYPAPSTSASAAMAAAESRLINSQHSANDLGSISEHPYNGAGRSSQRSLSKLSSDHSDNMNDRNTNGYTQQSSFCGSLPTREELQKAHMTILAAQQHGMYTGDEIEPLHHQLGSSNLQPATRYSGRDFYSSSTLGQQQQQQQPDQIDGYAVPQHGVLNRGGSFPPIPTTSIRGRHFGSYRSSGSISSIEDDFRGSTSGSAYNSPRPSLHARVDMDHRNNDMNHTPNTAGSVIQPTTLGEQEDLDSLSQGGLKFDQILLILRESISSTLVTTKALEKLAHSQLTQDDQNMLGQIGAPLVIADAMHSHRNILSVQLAACNAIWNMSGTAQNQLAFVDSGALDMILTAMDQFLYDSKLLETAIAVLSNLSAVRENISILDQKGAFTRIIKAMTDFSEISSLQVKGCSALTNLASHDAGTNERIMEYGAGGAVVVAMVMHPNDHYLIEKALGALRNLCANSDTNKIQIANLGGIDSVISAMQVHRDEVSVQQEGAWTLSNLAANHANKAVIGDCGGIDVVIRAMWVHSDNVALQEWCCRALFTLTLDAHNCDVVLEVGGISAIVNCMQGHMDSAIVQEMGCAILGNLARNDQSRMRIVEEESLDAIVLAMVLHSNDMQVQERACTVLVRLAIPANHNAMEASNIPELVRQAAQKFPDRCDEPATHVLNVFGKAY